MEQESSYYEVLYHDTSIQKLANSMNFQSLEEIWFDPYTPQNRLILSRLSNLNGKTILLLGNGTSIKEFFFLKSCSKLIYTDLSFNAVSAVKMVFSQSQLYNSFKGNVWFNVVNATELPFHDESVDIVYGYAFVHHLYGMMLDRFFSETYRVLKRGGLCVFLDNAYSPVWQFLKKTVLRPLQIYSHKRKGISPADLLATKKGGYTEWEIKAVAQKYGFGEFFFDRTSFFLWIWCRGVEKLLNDSITSIGKPVAARLDNLLSRYDCFKKNQLILVWGFRK